MIWRVLAAVALLCGLVAFVPPKAPSAYPHEVWPATNQWIDWQEPTPWTTTVTLPPMTTDPSQIVFEIKTWNQIHFAWENLDPSSGVPLADILGHLYQELLIRDSSTGVLRNLGGTHYWRSPYMAFPVPLGPYDGTTDAAGSSGFEVMCPGINCNTGGGVATRESTVALDFSLLPEWAKQNFRDGTQILFKPRVTYTGAGVGLYPLYSQHGWWSGTDAKVTCQLKVSLL